MSEYRTQKQNGKSGRRWLAYLLALAVVAGSAFSISTIKAYADGLTAVDGVVTFYQWEKVYNTEQLPTSNEGFHAMWVWNHDNKYYTGGTYVDWNSRNLYYRDKKDDDKFLRGEEKFVTSDSRNTPTLYFNGWDNDNHCPTYKIIAWSTDGRPLALYDAENALGVKTDSYDADGWGILCGGQRDTDYGCVKVFYNDKGGYDTGWYTSGTNIYGDDDEYDWDFHQLKLYVAREIKYSAITHDYTVRDGQVLNVDDRVVLMDGVTLTVEEGGTLSIEGQFYNNGIINNQGTVIIQEGACISSFDPREYSSGTMNCDGGDLLILATGKLCIERNHAPLTITNGSTVVNLGSIITGDDVSISNNAVVENRRGGVIYFGYYHENPGSMRYATQSTNSDGSCQMTGVSEETETGDVTITTGAMIVNEGTMMNYTDFWMGKTGKGIRGDGSSFGYGAVHSISGD